MKTIGFPISHKNRRTLVSADIPQLINPRNVFIETGFGEVLGIAEEESNKYQGR